MPKVFLGLAKGRSQETDGVGANVQDIDTLVTLCHHDKALGTLKVCCFGSFPKSRTVMTVDDLN